MAEKRFYESWEHPERPRLDLSGKRWLQQHFPPWRMPDPQGSEAGHAPRSPRQASGDERLVYTADHPEGGWLPTRMPNDVRTALFEEGNLPHPYHDRNSEVWSWVHEQDWWLRCRFHIPSGLARPGRRVQLCVNGVSAPASFWFNCENLGDAADATTRYRFDLPGPHDPARECLLTVCFRPVDEPDSFRRAPMFAGGAHAWDGSWPSITPIGLWDAIWLEALPAVRIRDVVLDTRLDSAEDRATVVVRMDLQADVPVQDRVFVKFCVTDEETGKPVVRLEGSTPCTTPAKPIQLAWSKPKLWWPRGLGRQALYRLDCEVLSGGQKDVWSTRFGLRHIDVRTEGDVPRVHVNDRQVYLRGGYWLPPDLMHGRSDPYDVERILSSGAEAGFNMVRVWGGAPLEPRHFYGICDRLGLLVWQEVLAASNAAGTETADSKRLAAVCGDIAQRLRYHPSLALWSTSEGHVPNLGAATVPATPAALPDATLETLLAADEEKQVIVPPANVARNAIVAVSQKSCFLEPSSAATLAPAIGVEGPLRMDSLRECISEAELWPPGPSCEHHAMTPSRYEGAGEFAATLGEQVWAGALRQAVRAQALVEQERLRAGASSGFTLWRLAEPWPAGSYGLLGPAGAPKVAYYWVKRVLRPYAVLIQDDGPIVTGGTISATLFLQNQGPSTLPRLRIEVHWLSTKGVLSADAQVTDVLEPNGQNVICDTRITLPDDGFALLRARLRFRNRILAEVTHPYTNRNWNAIGTAMRPVTADPSTGGPECSIKAVGRPLLCVEIPGDAKSPHSDNFFTLVPDEERAVRIGRTRGTAARGLPTGTGARALPRTPPRQL